MACAHQTIFAGPTACKTSRSPDRRRAGDRRARHWDDFQSGRPVELVETGKLEEDFFDADVPWAIFVLDVQLEWFFKNMFLKILR